MRKGQDLSESGFSIDGLRRREHASWRRMYENMVDDVYRYAYYRCRARSEVAEDITQEVFQRALQSIDGYHGDAGDLLPWLKGIALRILSRRVRTSRRRTGRVALSQAATPQARHVAAEAIDPAPAADDRIISEEQRLMIGAALSALKPQWEQLLRLKYCQGLTVQAISERLGLTVKATESSLGRARAAFRGTYARLINAKEPLDTGRT
ncbi:MAG: sigma-70 family RNA polymerase sigma factor [Phycisphaerales bacterium]|nr:MAG: sigma-70 family RNA polymerase sigma factor [Phycisphaerales bacterium]